LNAGVTAVEHVRFVDRAYRMPREDVPEALADYTRTMSAAARAGLVLTLRLIARRTTIDTDRRTFIEALADTATGARPFVDPSPAVKASAAPSALPIVGLDEPPTFQDTVDLVETWLPLADAERRRAATAHLTGLPAAHRGAFVEHVDQMASMITDQIAEHDANEDRAWGTAIEDQMSYQLAKLQTGQSDPSWLETKEELLRIQQLINTVLEVVR
jgi:hypothetical protein